MFSLCCICFLFVVSGLRLVWCVVCLVCLYECLVLCWSYLVFLVDCMLIALVCCLLIFCLVTVCCFVIWFDFGVKLFDFVIYVYLDVMVYLI